MKTEIPTAKELFDEMLDKDPLTTSTEMMIAFAKIHVEAALKEAGEKAETIYETHWSGEQEQEGSTYIDRDSILNAYPLTNIK